MSHKQEGSVAIIAAFFVLFSALLNPVVSVVISVSFLVVIGVVKLLKK